MEMAGRRGRLPRAKAATYYARSLSTYQELSVQQKYACPARRIVSKASQLPPFPFAVPLLRHYPQ